MNDPYAHINRVNRELADSPWGPTQHTGHQRRPQWQARQAPRHLVAGDFPDELLGRRRLALLLLSLACIAGGLACIAAALWLAWPWLPR